MIIKQFYKYAWFITACILFTAMIIGEIRCSSSGSGSKNSIAGTVRGAVAANVTITLSGASNAVTTTDSNGNYRFSGLLNGTYTVTPSFSGYAFTPANIRLTVNSNSTGNEFTSFLPFWNTQTSSTTNSLLGIAWSGSQFVAVGANGTIITSPDAVNWTSQFSSVSNPLFGVAWSGNIFVAVGGNNAAISWFAPFLVSPDGKNWTVLSLNSTGCSGSQVCTACLSSPQFYAIIWSGTQFVAVGTNCYGGPQIWTSPTGNTGSSWSIATTAYVGSNGSFWGVCWTGLEFLTVGDALYPEVNGGPLTQHNLFATSSNGVNWVMHVDNTVSSNVLTGVIWSGKLFVAVGYGGTILLSNDGINWQSQYSGTTMNLYGIAWSGSQFVAVGKAGTTLISSDGINWTQQPSGTDNDINAIIWTGSEFVAVGYQGMVLTAK